MAMLALRDRSGRATRGLRLACVLACVALLAACPGGGSGGGSPGMVNRAPVFTSATSVSVPEEITGIFHTAVATDPDGNALSYSITGGEDAARFRITAGGGLSFASAPDFENPGDSDGDNVYLLQLAASDGSARATQDLSVTVTDVASTGFRVRRVASGVSQPVFLAPVPDGSGRVYVVELPGRIRILDPASGAFAATPLLDLRGSLSIDGERGLLGFATAPDFADSGAFYVFATALDGALELRRYHVFAGDRDRADAASEELLLRQPHPRSNHNGGWIGFGPDGMLYVAIGDGGGSGDPDDNAQDPAVLLGKILRLDVGSDAFPADPERNYAIPVDNPFATGGGAPEVWALGLRNPFRNSFDPVSGALLIGDVGENAVEEIDLLPAGLSGANFGWSILEGTQPFKGSGGAGLSPPVAEYPHGVGTRAGNTVIGGYVYRGPVESLRGQYVFADFIRGNVWTLPLAALQPGSTLSADTFTVRNSEFAPDSGAFTNIASFGLDEPGNLYMVDMDGEIFVLEPTPIAVPARRSRALAAPQRHVCLEAWNGIDAYWRGGELVVGSEGFPSLRLHYERLERARPR